ncbi:hypothetical protein JDV02_010443 [Purpureocillium takamizusanense]|uniref:CFEM domain-containing protein n=1 Tax=Purpureocillium takamizusanense TaxID=2060973 RepID=A0A9Q8QSY7_9HYPO|nr:uncharacterized protein JDV02_010443 [Purpureocillium takamizusanense]UNI24716.1 hypothetical protein JDV02_010443 [Purpureocillium takamizusanense]
MKYTAVLSLALAALAAAQSRSDLPSCSLPCLDDAVAATSSCGKDDFACICKKFDKIQGAATGCILKGCGQDVALNQVLPATQKLCKKALAGGSGSSAAGSSTAPATPKGSSNTVSATATVAPPTSAQQPTEPPTTTAPTNPPSVTAGAAAVGPALGLAVMALGVFAL